MKMIIFLVFVFIPGLIFSQVLLHSRVKNLSAVQSTFTLSDETSVRSLQITLQDGNAKIVSGGMHYFINKNENYLLKDADGNLLIQVNKKNYSSTNETFSVVNCKDWYVALADTAGNIIAKGNYTMYHDDAEIFIEMSFYDESIAAMMAYQISNKSKKIADSNVILLILAGTF